MSTHREHGRLQKIVATVLVLALVGGVQWFIFARTRPPQPKVMFPVSVP